MTQTSARTHIWVKGIVQNVGFRAYVARSAVEIGVTGWVRNVSWDTVEAVAEGDPRQIEQFTQAIKRGPSASRVDQAIVEAESPTGEFITFNVRSSR